jgi:GGDEF domain-containing protein/ActR/RegA family two-component response regulator
VTALAVGEPLELHVVAVVADAATIQLMHRTLDTSGDRLTVATDLAEGLARAASEVPDVVLVDVALGKNAGLAVVHHVRAISPGVQVYALARAEHLALGAQAVALGGTGVLMMPLSGDELLTALSDVRTRRAEREVRVRLEREAAASRRGVSVVTQVAEIAEARNRRDAAERLARLLVDSAGAKRALVYLPAGEGSRQLMRVSTAGNVPESPAFCDDMEVLSWAAEASLEVIRLTVRNEHMGLVLLGGAPRRGVVEPFPFVELMAAQAATALALIGEREKSHRGAMKDPSSSAYTFAYFVDVAGREIDKARRHGRRFALATLSIEPGVEEPAGVEPDGLVGDRRPSAGLADAGTTQVPSEPLPSTERANDRPSSDFLHPREPSVEVAERVLSVVRDTDVLARVDETEFYLLLPETGGMGAHTCRRRILRQIGRARGQRQAPGPTFELTVGVATFPHDGSDLSQLLRVAKHRADASRNSVVRRLRLDRLALGDLVDALFWNLNDVAGTRDSGCELPRSVELPIMDLVGLAVAAVDEAARGGAVRVVATQHSGMCIGSAVRTALGTADDEIRFDAVDVSHVPGCGDLEALGIIAEHGAYSLVGRLERSVVRAVHAADPVFADLLVQRLGEAAGVRLVD